jgi:hypothetical protein
MKRWDIRIITHGQPAKDGRQSLDTHTISPDGREHFQCYYADATEVLKRLRHNIAEQFWFDRRRVRLVREAKDATASTGR